jgi:predicted dehydrogenase
MEPLRIGVLGAARIAEIGIVAPTRATGDRLVAVAARETGAAPRASQRSTELSACMTPTLTSSPTQDVEVVYNPLANALHAPWNLAAIGAGKHVLTEKPFASNAVEAREVCDAAVQRGSRSWRASTTCTTR